MKKSLLLAFIVLLIAAPSVLADTLVSGGSTWNPWVTPSEANKLSRFTAPAFWDNVSSDGNGCNIGFWVTTTPGCAVGGFYDGSPKFTGTAGQDFYYGTGTGTFSFTPDGYTVTGASIKTGPSALTGKTDIGWYSLDDGTRHTMLDDGHSVPFAIPSGNFGFYASVNDSRFTGNWANYTTGSLIENRANFVVFDVSKDDGTRRFIIGFEDVYGGKSDYDYNDAVIDVSFTPTPVPEPGTMALLGLGLVGVARAARRKK